MKHKHSITVDAEGIAHVVIVGDGTVVEARNFVEDATNLFSEKPDHIFDAIVDMTDSGESTYDGMLEYRALLQHKQLGRIAFIMSKNRIVDMLTRLAVSSKERDVKFCNTEKEALEWLRAVRKGSR